MQEFLKEQFKNLDKILYLAKIDLIKTYKSSLLGWTWAILKPTITILIYYLALIIGLKASKNILGAPYFLWLICGIIPWFFIKDILQPGSECLTKYDYLITKTRIPISIIPTFNVLAKLFIHLILITIIILIYLFSGYGISIYILQLPIYLLLMFIFLTFLCLLFSLLSAISKDFLNLIKTLTFALFWLSGIIWDISLIDIAWIKYLLYLNPITYIVNGYRNCFIKKIWIWNEPLQLICFLSITIITIILGIFIYKKTKKSIPDLL